MSDRANPSPRIEPVIDRTERIGGAGRLIVLAFGLVGVSIGFALIEPERALPFVLALLGLLAVVGVVTLFASAIGLIRVAGRGNDDSVGKAFVDAMGEGVLITERDGRILYANSAYAQLIGAANAAEVSGRPEIRYQRATLSPPAAPRRSGMRTSSSPTSPSRMRCAMR
jgi:two-component system cell cycle sensor histidine kinase/response regulator CckA